MRFVPPWLRSTERQMSYRSQVPSIKRPFIRPDHSRSRLGYCQHSAPATSTTFPEGFLHFNKGKDACHGTSSYLRDRLLTRNRTPCFVCRFPVQNRRIDNPKLLQNLPSHCSTSPSSSRNRCLPFSTHTYLV